ncbi:MAG: flagellar hook-basal body complex protein, partial [Planctomycetes bacterium]|nr:flagellar hook-basal body complex protein [Planctomycetota bacterium]
TFRAPSGPSGNLGGVNGRQTGYGTQIGSIDQLHTQGSLIATSRNFDLAIQGRGFFVVSDGTQDFYTRVGTFALDRDSNFVDSRTGFKVQNASGSDITLDTDSVAPAVATTEVSFAGNLPAIITGPLAEIQESSVAFEDHQPAELATTFSAGVLDLAGDDLVLNIDDANPVTITFPASFTAATPTDVKNFIEAEIASRNISPGLTVDISQGALTLVSNNTGNTAGLSASGQAATELGIAGLQESGSESLAVATTELNDLSANVTDYVDGDIILLTGINAAGQSVNVSFTYGQDGTTMDDLLSSFKNAFPDTSFVLRDGKFVGTNDNTGETNLSLFIKDASGTTGTSQWSNHTFEATVHGADADTRATTITVYDSLGIPHTLSGVYTRQDDETWNLDLSVPAGEGTITGSPITQINFDSEGRYRGASGSAVDIAWSSNASPQTIEVDFGTIGELSGLTQLGEPSSAQAVSQNGFASGTLGSINVTQGGVIQGYYSNGAIIDMDTLAVAVFQNNEGLAKEGSTLFKQSDNSGVPLIGQATVGGAGGIVAGSLEGSNVDTAEEFVRLIEAQRSFQGSARIVTTADEIFAELLQIV